MKVKELVSSLKTKAAVVVSELAKELTESVEKDKVANLMLEQKRLELKKTALLIQIEQLDLGIEKTQEELKGLIVNVAVTNE